MAQTNGGNSGSTSNMIDLFLQDSSSTTGAGLTGLTNASGSLTAYYHRNTASSAVAISLVSATVGTFTSGGFIAVDGTNMPGLYQLHVPDAAYVAGAQEVTVMLKGATNLAPKVYKIPLATSVLGTTSGTAQAGTVNSITLASGASATNNIYNGQTIKITSGTGAQQARVVSGYNGTTKIATVDRPFQTAPDNTSVYTLLATDAPALNASLQVSVAGTSVAIRTGTAQAGTASSITLDSGALATDNVYRNDIVTITSGTGLGQTRTIVNYVGSTKVATVGQNWTTTPDSSSVFAIYASTGPTLYSDQGVAQAGSSSTITLASTASATSSIYVGSIVTILAGTDVGDTSLITAYNGSTKVATVSPNFAVTPDTTSVYAVIPTQSGTGVSPTQDVNVVSWNGTGVQANVAGIPKVDVGYTLGTVSAGAAGSVGIDWGQVVNKTTTNALTGTTISTSQVVASVTGAVGSVTGAVGSVTGAVGSVTGAVGSVTGNVGGNVTGTIGNLAAGAKTDVTNAVWDATMASHVTAGSTGAALNAAGSAGDPWATAVPGAYSSGTAGFILGTNLNATVSSRLATSGYTTPPTVAAIATGVWTDTTAGDFTTATSPGKIIFTQLGSAFTTTSSSVFTTAALANGPTGTAPTTAQIATAVWTDLLASSDFSTASSIGAALKAMNTTITSTGVVLAATGLDAIPITDPGNVAGMDKWPKMLVALWRDIYKKSSLARNTGILDHYKDDGTTVNTTAVCTDDGTTQTKGAAT